MDRIYLDNAATTAVSQPVMEAMLPYYMQVYGNPSSIHSTGATRKSGRARAAAGRGGIGVQRAGNLFHRGRVGER